MPWQGGWRTFLANEKHSVPGAFLTSVLQCWLDHSGDIPVTGEAAQDRDELLGCQGCVSCLK